MAVNADKIDITKDINTVYVAKTAQTPTITLFGRKKPKI